MPAETLSPQCKKSTGVLVVTRNNLEWVYIVFLLSFSLINRVTLLLYLLGLVVFLIQGSKGAIKAINLIALRTIISPGLGPDISAWQEVKLLVLLFYSLYLFRDYLRLPRHALLKVRSVLYPVLAFTLYNVARSLFSPLPVIAVAKTISYSLVFLAVLVGVAATRSRMDWVRWLFTLLSLTVVGSLPLALVPLGYISSGSFQGMTNHPNMFGIVNALFLSLVLARFRYFKKHSSYIYVCVAVFNIVLTNSRTAGLTAVILLTIVFLLHSKSKLLVRSLGIFSALLLILVFFSENPVNTFVTDFLLKGQETNILASRQMQLDNFIRGFRASPLFGHGFGIPTDSAASLELTFNHVVEPGNLFFAVLLYSGVVGLIIFLIYLRRIMRDILNPTILLPLAVILISQGEMVFFSSNNIGPWCYIFIANHVVESRPMEDQRGGSDYFTKPKKLRDQGNKVV